MNESFTKKLEKTDSPEHNALLCYAKCCIDKSRKEMSKNYDTWDKNDELFRSRRPKDREDRSAETQGKPAKLIIPLTYSQVMTYVAYSVMTLTQNKRFYEFEPTGTEDNPLREPMELIVERDLRKNQWQAFLVQFFLDMGRFSIGAAEVCYKEEHRNIRLPQTKTEAGAFGEEQTVTTSQWQKIPVFIGNRVYPVSPYRVFPDPGVPLTRYQEGEFCGSEDMFSMSSLRSMDNLMNLDKIPKMTVEEYDKRKKNSRIDVMETRENKNLGSDSNGDADAMVKSGPVVITKLVCDIIPKNFEVADGGAKLGTEDFPVRYLIWYANDKTIIRFEEAYYLHGMFPWLITQYLPDQHQFLNESLADVCDPIANLVTWLINAHVTSVKSTIESKFVIDPAGVDMKSIESRSPYIFLKKGVSGMGVDRYIKQFQVSDPTQKFMDDAEALKGMLEVVTAFSSNMQGQYNQGRRSATEARVVTQGATARARVGLGATWDTFFEPLAKQLVANNRQEMDAETFARIVGVGPHGPDQMPTEVLFELFKADPVTIATAEDFFVYDGTSPSEKAFLAQSLQEVLMTILSNPQVAQIFNLDPKRLMDEIYTLRGVTNLSRFALPAQPMPGNVAPMPVPGAPQPGPTGSSAPQPAVSNG